MSWKPEYIILILISTTIDYFSAIAISQAHKKIARKFFLSLSLISNLGMLFAFKYLNFFSNSVNSIISQFDANIFIPNFNILLPVGISFYTFQTLSYTIDVYKKKIPPEKHFGIFAVFVSFFPQLVAGPIERAQNLLPQFRKKISFDYKNFKEGSILILWGFFKKIVIADRLAMYVNQTYNNPDGYGGMVFIISTVFFAFQIYCDFSGYSDIAIGSAKIMGIDLMKNFRSPYFSKSIAEFWRRWHISLSTWFQDYVFTPLYVKISKFKKICILSTKARHIITFAIAIIIADVLLGLWHGANWTFVFFGLYHGILIILYYLGRKRWDAFPLFLRMIMTFFMVNIGWVFFLSNSMSDAFIILNKILFLSVDGLNNFINLNKSELVISISAILILLITEFIQNKPRTSNNFLLNNTILRWSIYYFLLISILAFGQFTSQDFIYFQF